MDNENYERILSRISKYSNIEKEEIGRRVEAKRAKLSGLISKEGAAQIVAAELGVNFDNEKLKINELLPGMRKVNVVGKVINVFPVRTFERGGKENKVVNLVMADETSNIKVVLWDTNHIDLIEKGKVVEGKVVEINNASVRENEVHLGSFSEFKLSNSVLEDVKTEKNFNYKKISDFKISDNVGVRAFIVQLFEPKFFNVCPECGKKANSEGENFVCQVHGKIVSEKRAVMNIILDDGTETIRGVVFHDKISSLGIKDLDSLDSEKMSKQKEELLGKEMIFSGSVRNNKFFNSLEFIVEDLREVDVDELVAQLEIR